MLTSLAGCGPSGRARAADRDGPALCTSARARWCSSRSSWRARPPRRWPPWSAPTATSPGCWSCPSRATATCGSPSPPNWPGSCCRTSRPFWRAPRRWTRKTGDAVRAVRWTRRSSLRAEPGGRRRSPRLLGRSTRFRQPRRALPGADPAVPLLGRWLTYFAERAAAPGLVRCCCAATEALGRALGDRAERPGGRQPGRAARLDRPARGQTGPTRPTGRGSADLAAGRTGHRPGFRQRGARPADRATRRRRRDAPWTRHRGAARPSSSPPGG